MKPVLYIFILVCTSCFIHACTKPTQACFTYLPTNNISKNSSISFDASCTTNGGNTYKWNFGDGTPDTTLTGVATITHTYNTSGTFTVTLKATRKDGVVWKENNNYITTKNITVQ